MNERIRELAEQATTYIEPTENSGEGWIFDKEKFAQLIVQECISQINTQCFLTHSNEWIQKGAWNAYICAAIKHHFGDES
jgi:hypothetical protein